jgi:hypothetical protein
MKFKLSSEFGVMEEVRGNIPHSGIDLAMPEGTELRSIFNGIVEKVYDGSGKIGEGVKIQTEDGQHLIYGHMSDVKVHVGDKIHEGDVIGLSGNTGLSTGPHLHFGMTDQSGLIDPTPFADKVSSLSGDEINGFIPGPMQSLGLLKDKFLGSTQEHVVETTQEVLMGIAVGAFQFFVDMSGFIALVGGGILILSKLAGFDKGYKWAGLLFLANTLIKYLGGASE